MGRWGDAEIGGRGDAGRGDGVIGRWESRVCAVPHPLPLPYLYWRVLVRMSVGRDDSQGFGYYRKVTFLQQFAASERGGGIRFANSITKAFGT